MSWKSQVESNVFLMDVDGILGDFIGGFIQAYRQLSGVTLPRSTFDSYDLFSKIPEDYHTSMEKLIRGSGFCESLGLLPGAQEGYARVASKVPVYIVTSPYKRSPTWAHERLVWLERHFGIQEDQVISTRAKHRVFGRFLLEDSYANVVGWQLYWPEGTGMLWTQESNASEDYRSRVASWDEVIRKVETDLSF